MYKRELGPALVKSLQKYPVLTLVGARQSGKTTLVRSLFTDFEYVNLEAPDVRARAKQDPRGFLSQLQDRVVLDEIQRVPELTSYIQVEVDEPAFQKKAMGKFVLTGSNGTMLLDHVSQSLAGRTELFELAPLSLREIQQKKPEMTLYEHLFTGGYPRIFEQDLDPQSWLKSYFQLYVEKDVRLISNIMDIDLFETFVRLCAGRVGQLMNLSAIANEAGVSVPTAKRWLSALKTTYIGFSLRPHFKNFNKRLVKTPKFYFYDTGLLCYLLGITEMGQLETHPLRGHIFENFMISEIKKNSINANKKFSDFFWRDQKGQEVDYLLDSGGSLFPLEIKLSKTFSEGLIKSLSLFQKMSGSAGGSLVYAGDSINYKGFTVINWKEFLTQSKDL